MTDSITQQAGPALTEIGTVVLNPKGEALNITGYYAPDAADIAAGYRVVPAYVHLAAPLAVEGSRERCASSDAKDAARYRWLARKEFASFGDDEADARWASCFEDKESLDCAIDAAMAAASSGDTKEKMNG